jgi:hypothetical protein
MYIYITLLILYICVSSKLNYHNLLSAFVSRNIAILFTELDFNSIHMSYDFNYLTNISFILGYKSNLSVCSNLDILKRQIVTLRSFY